MPNHPSNSKQVDGWVRKPKRAAHPNPDDDLPKLRPGMYPGRHLARVLRRNAFIPIWDKFSAEQLEFFKHSEFIPVEDIPPLSRSEKEELLEHFFETRMKIIDTLFFFSSVAKHVEIRFDSDPVSDQHGFWRDDKKIYTVVFNHASKENQGHAVWGNFVSKMLHESLHVFLQIYMCQCSRCRRLGHTGMSHTTVWANAMIAIQDGMNDDSSLFDCKISESVKLEMQRSGWVPRNRQLKRWRIEGIAGYEDQPEPNQHMAKDDFEEDEGRGEKESMLGQEPKHKKSKGFMDAVKSIFRPG